MTLEPPPRLDGKHAIVTGGTGGVGYETVRALGALGATVTIAARDPAKGASAVARLRAHGLEATVRPLDLASLASVQAFAEATDTAVDILVCNAGVMRFNSRERTVDGFERNVGVNHLGHFALVGRLLPRLASASARVVLVSSLAHRAPGIELDDLDGARDRRPFRAYPRSKLANLVFALELDRRARAAGVPITSVAAHPGWARTDLVRFGAARGLERAMSVPAGLILAVGGQSARDGARPIVCAAACAIEGGSYLGPGGRGERTGAPRHAVVAAAARDPEAARRLWERSERLTSVPLPVLPERAA